MTDKEKVAQWMIQQGYATGHGDTVEDLLKELECQILENWHRAMVNGVETEREACAKLCDEIESEAYGKHRQKYDPYDEGVAAGALACVEAIRARGEKA